MYVHTTYMYIYIYIYIHTHTHICVVSYYVIVCDIISYYISCCLAAGAPARPRGPTWPEPRVHGRCYVISSI